MRKRGIVVKKSDRYHHGSLRSSLMNAAVRIVHKDGIHALTFQALARQAGVSSGAPYHHFPSREALLTEIAIDGTRHLLESMRKARDEAGADPRARCEAIGRSYMIFAVENTGYFRVINAPELQHAENATLKELQAEGVALINGEVMAWSGSGLREDVNVPLCSMLSWAVVYGASVLWIDGPLRSWLPGLSADDMSRALTTALGQLLSSPPERQSQVT